MPRNAAGNYTLPLPPVVPGTTIVASFENTTDSDIATELTNSLDRNGRGGMLAPFKIFDGTVSAPGIAFTQDPDNGFYRIGTDDWAAAVGGAKILEFAPGQMSLTGALSLTGSLSVGGSLSLTGTVTSPLSVAGMVTATLFQSGVGTAAAPAYSFTAFPATGFYAVNANSLRLSLGNADYYQFGTAGLTLAPGMRFGWASDGTFSAADTGLLREAAGVVQLNNGTAGQYRDLKARSVYAGNGSATVPAFAFVGAPTTGFYGAASIINVTLNGGARYQFDNGAFFPLVDNAVYCGYSGFRWTSIWAASGTINTSDARMKKNVADSTLGLTFIETLRPVSYQWIVGRNVVTTEGEGAEAKSVVIPLPGVRTHWGLIAQEVKQAVDASGVEDFAGYVQTDLNDSESELGLRYSEFIAPIIKAVQELSAKVKALEVGAAA